MNKWQPIETAPEGETFLAWSYYSFAPERSGPIVAKRQGDVIVCDWDEAELSYCTHWMPLPKGPK